MNTKTIIGSVIGITLGLIIMAVTLPLGFEFLFNATWTGMNPGLVTLIEILLPLGIIISMLALFVPYFRSKNE